MCRINFNINGILTIRRFIFLFIYLFKRQNFNKVNIQHGYNTDKKKEVTDITTKSKHNTDNTMNKL